MMAVLTTIIIVAVVIIAFIASYFKTEQKKHKTSISFKESLDLTELPIITLLHNGNKINFLLDTGSNDSFIASNNSSLISEDAEIQVYKMNVAGYNGVTEAEQTAYTVSLKYKNNEFVAELIEAEHLNAAFAHIKITTGVTIHGILGSKFLEKHKYVLDFADYIAYQK